MRQKRNHVLYHILLGLIAFLVIGIMSAQVDRYDVKPEKKMFEIQAHRITSAGQWKLVFADEFDAPAIDVSKWKNDVGADIWGNKEQQYYTDGENVCVENGYLVLEARRKDEGGKAYTSARVTTHGTFDFTYGRVEVRATLPQARGTWPAIWLLPSECVYGRGVMSGEIDIAEHVGHESNRFYATLHTQQNNAIRKNAINAMAKLNDPDGFHVYALEWGPDAIVILIDGDEVLRYVPEDVADWEQWPFDQDFYLIMNIAVGGTWGGQQGIDQEAFPQKMMVDYVRIYQKDSNRAR